MSIGEILREVRHSKKLTQMQVSQRAKVSQTFLSQLEAGIKNPSKGMLQKLCALYKVPPQAVIWKSITEKDVEKNKLPAFREFKPIMDKLMNELFNI